MPDIITRALLESKGIPTRDIVAAIWGRKLSGGYEPAEATGTLPLTFRSNGTVLLDYRIYGNTVETANLVPLTTQKTATGGGIAVTIDSSGVWHVTGTASQDVNILFDLEEAFTVPVALDNGGEGVIQFFNSVAMDDGSGSETARVLFYYGNFQRDYMGLHIQNRSITQYSDLANMSINRLGIWVKQGITCDFTLSPMVVDDGIVHDEYISPETTEVQGVGVQTENLWDRTTATKEFITYAGNIIPNVSGWALNRIAVEPNATYSVAAADKTYWNNFATYYQYRDEDNNIVDNVRYGRNLQKATLGTVPSDAKYLVICFQNAYTENDVLRDFVVAKSSTFPDSYIPYGYKLPMVSRTENAPYHRTETPIYIGNTQLMQDEYVSYSEQKIYKFGENLAELSPIDPPVPLPELPTFADADTVLDYEETPPPSEVWVKYQKGD